MQFLNLLLVLNTSLANLLNIFCSGITVIGLIRKKENVSGFKAAITVLSAVNLALGLLDLSTFPIFLYPNEKDTYLLGQFYPSWLVRNLARLSDVMVRESMTMLGVVFIYRTMVVLDRNGRVKLVTSIAGVIGIVVPVVQAILLWNYDVRRELTCNYWCLDNTTQWPDTERIVVQVQREQEWIDLVVFVAVVVIGIRCYRKINGFFSKGDFSEKTKRLQKSLSRGMLIMILIHTAVIYSSILIFIVSFVAAWQGVENVDGIIEYIVMSEIVVETWQIPALSLVVLWSVRGFIKIRSPFSSRENTTVTPLVVTKTTKY